MAAIVIAAMAIAGYDTRLGGEIADSIIGSG
jgi:uncharacterized membrane protein